MLDLCAAPGGKTSQLRGDVTAVEIDPNRASELRANLATMRATNVTVVEADGTRPAARADRLRPRARRRAVLGARRPRAAARPPLAREPAAGAPARAAPRCGRAREARRHGRLLGLHDERRRERGGRRRERPRGRCRSATSGRSSRIRATPGVPPDAAARPRHERLLRQPTPRLTSGWRRGLARTGSGRSRSNRRSTRRTFASSASRSTCCCARARASSTSTSATAISSSRSRSGPIVLQAVAPRVHAVRRRRDRLPPDGGQPGAPLSADRTRRRRQRHLPLRGGRRRARRRSQPRASTASESASHSTPRPSRRTWRGSRAAPTSCSA